MWWASGGVESKTKGTLVVLRNGLAGLPRHRVLRLSGANMLKMLEDFSE